MTTQGSQAAAAVMSRASPVLADRADTAGSRVLAAKNPAPRQG